MIAGGALLIVNEWDARSLGLTPPAHVFARLDADPRWRRVAARAAPFGRAELSLALYRRAG